MDGQVLIGGSVVSQVDIVYLSSWKQCASKIAALLPIGTEGNGGQPTCNVMTILLPFFPILERNEHPKSSHLSHKLQIEMASPIDRVRLHATRA